MQPLAVTPSNLDCDPSDRWQLTRDRFLEKLPTADSSTLCIYQCLLLLLALNSIGEKVIGAWKSKSILNNNSITDLKPLSTLTNLYLLELNNNSITDLRPLATLTNLSNLELNNNSITDLRPLATLTNLSYVTLDNNSIADLKPLSTLTNLFRLSLENNSITDLKLLSTLTNLYELHLGNNPSLTDKTCPVQPESICRFVPSQSEND